MQIKRFAILLIAVIITVGTSGTPAFADFVAHPRGPIVVRVNGNYVDFSVQPQFIVADGEDWWNGEVYVELGAIARALGIRPRLWNNHELVSLREIERRLGARTHYARSASHIWVMISAPSIVPILAPLIALLILLIFRKKFLPKNKSKE